MYREKTEVKGLTDNVTCFKFDRRLGVRQVQDNPIYAGMVESLDTAVGIVMARLKKTGLDKNTVVIFTGDNGGVFSGDAYSASLLPFRGGKGRQWEGSIRELYIIHVPRMTEVGSFSQVPAIGMDFYPTMLELAGLPAKPKQHVDGVSLVPVLRGKPFPIAICSGTTRTVETKEVNHRRLFALRIGSLSSTTKTGAVNSII